MSYLLVLACDLQMNLFVAKHVGLNSSWAELACFSLVLSSVGWICSTNRASSVGLCIPHHTGQVLLPWRRGATRSVWSFPWLDIPASKNYFQVDVHIHRLQNEIKSSFTVSFSFPLLPQNRIWAKQRSPIQGSDTTAQYIISILSSHVVTGQNIVFVHIQYIGCNVWFLLERRRNCCTCECVTVAGCNNFSFITFCFKCLVLLGGAYQLNWLTKTSCCFYSAHLQVIEYLTQQVKVELQGLLLHE